VHNGCREQLRAVLSIALLYYPSLPLLFSREDFFLKNGISTKGVLKAPFLGGLMIGAFPFINNYFGVCDHTSLILSVVES